MSDPDYRIAKLDLRAGDILVVKLDSYVPMETILKLKEKCEREFPCVRIMVIDKGIDLAVLSAEEIAQRSAA